METALAPLWERCLKELTFEILEEKDKTVKERIFLELYEKKRLKKSIFELFGQLQAPPLIVCLDLSESGNIVTDSTLSLVSSLSQLQSLRLKGCRAITNEGLVFVSKMKQLLELDISTCLRITDRGLTVLERLTKLRKFVAGEIGQSSGGLGNGLCKALIGMKESLIHLGLLRTQLHCGLSSISSSGVLVQLCQHLESLEELNLSGTTFDEREISSLARFRSLKEINLSGCFMVTESTSLKDKLVFDLKARSDVGKVKVKKQGVSVLRIIIEKQDPVPSDPNKDLSFLHQFKTRKTLIDPMKIKEIILSSELNDSHTDPKLLKQIQSKFKPKISDQTQTFQFSPSKSITILPDFSFLSPNKLSSSSTITSPLKPILGFYESLADPSSVFSFEPPTPPTDESPEDIDDNEIVEKEYEPPASNFRCSSSRRKLIIDDPSDSEDEKIEKITNEEKNEEIEPHCQPSSHSNTNAKILKLDESEEGEEEEEEEEINSESEEEEEIISNGKLLSVSRKCENTPPNQIIRKPINIFHKRKLKPTKSLSKTFSAVVANAEKSARKNPSRCDRPITRSTVCKKKNLK